MEKTFVLFLAIFALSAGNVYAHFEEDCVPTPQQVATVTPTTIPTATAEPTVTPTPVVIEKIVIMPIAPPDTGRGL